MEIEGTGLQRSPSSFMLSWRGLIDGGARDETGFHRNVWVFDGGSWSEGVRGYGRERERVGDREGREDVKCSDGSGAAELKGGVCVSTRRDAL